ncbi:hypothetical protein TNCV_3755641 [Trichonephila clavipes]|nr:hypothetical protein TNCV_3755641 [Trichonephila clavipes]
MQTAVTDQLKAIPISDFHQCYEEWKKLLQRCVASEGSYFEGDNVEFGGHLMLMLIEELGYLLSLHPLFGNEVSLVLLAWLMMVGVVSDAGTKGMAGAWLLERGF